MTFFMTIPPFISGTFSNLTRLEREADCTPCPGGEYCEGLANNKPTGDCAEMYYCPVGSWSEEQVPCTVGHFCPSGVADPIPCNNNSFVSIDTISAYFSKSWADN